MSFVAHLSPKETSIPATAAALAEMVRKAYADGSPVHVSLEKINRTVDYPAEDMTITIEAGMTIAELNRILAEKHQCLPVDVPRNTTIGQAIAMNTAGPRRFGHGTIRDYLLGFTAVDGMGTIFSGGGRVVKNAAGYNMARLLAGSNETLAIITQATLMVRPMPATSGVLTCETRDFAMAETLLASLVHAPMQPVSIEFEAGRFTDENPLFGPIDAKNAARVCVGFEGDAAEVAWIMDTLAKDWMSLGAKTPAVAPHMTDDRYWRWATEFAADATIRVLPSRVVHTVEEIRRNSPHCCVQAHAGDGIIRVQGASLAFTHSITAAERNLRLAMKERFDPKDILTPLQMLETP